VITRKTRIGGHRVHSLCGIVGHSRGVEEHLSVFVSDRLLPACYVLTMPLVSTLRYQNTQKYSAREDIVTERWAKPGLNLGWSGVEYEWARRKQVYNDIKDQLAVLSFCVMFLHRQRLQRRWKIVSSRKPKA
jgi:hypothetical protein